MKPASLRTTVTIAVVLLLAIAGVNLFRFIKADEAPQTEASTSQLESLNPAQAYIFPISETSYIPFLDSSRPRPNLTAKAAIVYDMQSSRFLYAHDTKKQLPIASLTKIMTAVVVLENLNSNDIVTVKKESLRVDGLKQDLYAGERISVSNLMQMMLVQSSNDAAYALAAFAKEKNLDLIKLMNQKAEALSMSDTLFLDPAGLSDNGRSTVQDLSRLVVYAMRYSQIWKPLQEKQITVASEDGTITHVVQNTNQLLDVMDNISGGKTGYTDGALGCMILIVDIPGHKDTIVSIILGSKDRFGDTKKLVDWIQDAYRWK